MGISVRKRPCPCGTGRPARDCCGRFRRFSEAEVARSYLLRQARWARDLVGPFSPRALTVLQTEAAALPAQLPRPFTEALLGAHPGVASELRRLARATARADDEERPSQVSTARADTPMARVAMVKAMVALRERGRADEHVVAAGILELAGGASPLADAALRYAAAGVSAGEARPGPALTSTHRRAPVSA